MEKISAGKLEVGVPTTITNDNPSNWRVEIRTQDGSLISFPISAGGEFTVTQNGGLSAFDIHVIDVLPLGPRSVD